MEGKTMLDSSAQSLNVAEFLNLSEGEENLELIDGRAVPKMSPKYFHASIQLALLSLLGEWCKGKGRVRPEWGVILQRRSQAWVPTPDVLYISYERLPAAWSRNEACPLPAELVIEVISPGQTFGQMTGKAEDYLLAGIGQVWVVDPEARSITVFYPDRSPSTFTGSQPVEATGFADLLLNPEQLFSRAEL